LIICVTTPVTAALLRETRTIPIVFASVGDPVRSGFVESLARPGGNASGFASLEPSLGSKWPALLKEIAPDLRQVGIIFNPETAVGRGLTYSRPIEVAAASFRIEEY
jgi:putative ABC transport system substrate-binding protein